ncbi:MAG: hypothetical protein K2X00_04915 [Nitrospiraceae bacterium]|jgi:hypothetical protein|nr:hypothetical protein [Nitrospiraceae bacterium]OQW66658.1 MAG: hypothetical protein BVN29_05595 [Nitrospira sp. ST-bin5]
MPVNMDPTKKRKSGQAEPTVASQPVIEPTEAAPLAFGTETHADREKDLADAEWKNLWDATEVIDMDKV